jgi:hypothetical protein
MLDLTVESCAAVLASIPETARDRLAAVRVDLTGDPAALCDAIPDVSPVVWSHRVVAPLTADVASGPHPSAEAGTTYGWCTVAIRAELASLAERVAAIAERTGVTAHVVELAPFGPHWTAGRHLARVEVR